MTVLFVDESKSKGYTIVAAAIVPADVATMRREVTRLRKPGQRRVHFVHESDSRRREILSALERLGMQARLYHATGMKESEAREACLVAMVRDAGNADVTRLVLERDESIVKFDRQVLFRETNRFPDPKKITYEHESASAEPLLWIPDAIAWGHARGGEWKKRIAPLIMGIEYLRG